MSVPLTVLMPVFNTIEYLDEAVASILQQQYEEYEFLIIDDGSTDGCWRRLQAYSDPRIRLFRNDTNEGLIATLNKGLELAQGRYIARMDSG
ncbi:MAG: glycosyltransferase family 2 protein [Balneolaceae bacterium]|nr:glycosyltransferase family 2 protein [Balneolaceae bacterium]